MNDEGLMDLETALDKLVDGALRVKKERDLLLIALKEIEWHCEGREDIDNNGGPNLAMRVRRIALEAIEKATGEA